MSRDRKLWDLIDLDLIASVLIVIAFAAAVPTVAYVLVGGR